nr:MAG TPA: hypothetical protein [Caudoviricetes sp.]
MRPLPVWLRPIWQVSKLILGPRRRFYLASYLHTCRFYVRCALFLISCSVSYIYNSIISRMCY